MGLIAHDTITKCLTDKPQVVLPDYSPEEIEYVCYNSKWNEIFTQNSSRINLYYFQKKDVENHFIQDYIKNRQQETIPDYSHIIQLGMTYTEVETRWGTPDIIDEMNDASRYFQMWTYSTGTQISRLYFEDDKLVRIEE